MDEVDERLSNAELQSLLRSRSSAQSGQVVIIIQKSLHLRMKGVFSSLELK